MNPSELASCSHDKLWAGVADRARACRDRGFVVFPIVSYPGFGSTQELQALYEKDQKHGVWMDFGSETSVAEYARYPGKMADPFLNLVNVQCKAWNDSRVKKVQWLAEKYASRVNDLAGKDDGVLAEFSTRTGSWNDTQPFKEVCQLVLGSMHLAVSHLPELRMYIAGYEQVRKNPYFESFLMVMLEQGLRSSARQERPLKPIAVIAVGKNSNILAQNSALRASSDLAGENRFAYKDSPLSRHEARMRTWSIRDAYDPERDHNIYSACAGIPTLVDNLAKTTNYTYELMIEAAYRDQIAVALYGDGFSLFDKHLMNTAIMSGPGKVYFNEDREVGMKPIAAVLTEVYGDEGIKWVSEGLGFLRDNLVTRRALYDDGRRLLPHFWNEWIVNEYYRIRLPGYFSRVHQIALDEMLLDQCKEINPMIFHHIAALEAVGYETNTAWRRVEQMIMDKKQESKNSNWHWGHRQIFVSDIHTDGYLQLALDAEKLESWGKRIDAIS